MSFVLMLFVRVRVDLSSSVPPIWTSHLRSADVDPTDIEIPTDGRVVFWGSGMDTVVSWDTAPV